jgi:purine-binding chemotaxis protein CheW
VAGAGEVPSEFERQLIVFSLHDEHYGLPIASVREIIRYTPPRVTAAARGLIQGLINLRGLVLPVVDLSERLGATIQITDATRILVIEVGRGVVGLIVDTVDGVTHVLADQVTPLPGAGDDALGGEIAAIDDRLIMLVDPDRALGHVLGAPPEPASANPEPGPPSAGRARDTAPRPEGPPPARRRSGATPQVPRRPPR